MGVPQPAPVAPDPSAETSAEYDAFFSYTSGADAKLVRRTERFIESFHRRRLLRRLQLKALTICVDGSDIRPRFGDAIESVDETLRRYVLRSRRLVVFCSPAAARSRYVDGEIRAFLETHPAGAVLPVVTAGDPSTDAAAVFPPALREGKYDQAIWLDFRGGATWPWQRRSMRIRPFREERVKLASELHGRGPDILPAWKRAETIRRRLTGASVAAVAALVVVAAALGVRSYAQRIAQDVNAAINAGSDESLPSLEQRAATAVSWWHDGETEAAFRLAASTVLHGGGTSARFSGPVALSAGSAAAARLDEAGALEVTPDVHAGAWQRASSGPFQLVDISDDGKTVAALGEDTLVVWRDGSVSACAGRPKGARAHGLSLDPTGTRVAALVESRNEWSAVIGRVEACGNRSLVERPLWGAPARTEARAVIRGNPGRRPGIALNAGGRALAVSSEAGWLLARVGDGPEGALEPLNGVLEAAFQSDRPETASPTRAALIVLDEAFSADGKYAAIVPALEGATGRGPRPVLLPLLEPMPVPIPIDGSRGAYRIALARNATRVGYALDRSVRIWDWEHGAPSIGGDTPTATRAGGLAFAGGDRLLLATDQVAQSRLYAFDALNGTLVGQLDTPAQASSVTSGGAHGERALLRFQAADGRLTDSNVFELRAPTVLGRWPRTERLKAGALLRPAGVAVIGFTKALRIATGNGSAMHESPLPSSPLQLAPVGGAVVVLLDDGRVLRCAIAEGACDGVGPIDRERRSIAADEAGVVYSGCANGAVVLASQPCRAAPAPAGAAPVTVLAVSTGAVLRIGNGACVGAPGSSACDPLPRDVNGIVGGAVSSNGAVVATAVGTEQGGRVDVYRRGFERWFPWPSRGYVLSSRIPVPGTVLAIRFLAHDAWLQVAAVWNAEVVVRCVPIAADAFAQTRCPDA